MNWKYWLTPAEPRRGVTRCFWRLGVVILMTLTYGVWYPGGPVLAMFATIRRDRRGACVAKLIMRS
jgi:hypothetical protein